MHELYSKYISSRARIKVKSVGHKDCVLDIVPMLPPCTCLAPTGHCSLTPLTRGS